ncbi:porin [Pasteurella sp. PK-2025]|uniref:porin n=1 Tax=Pasteurella sp. PK-2025 TaxID=3413133 RepID=UPI003C73F557
MFISYLYGGIGKPLDQGDRVINFASDSFNGFSFGVGYVFEKDVAKEAAREGRGAVVAGLYERKIGDVGFKVGAGYSEQQKSKVVNKSEKEKIFKVGGEVSYTAFAAGVDYLQSKKSGTQEKKRGIELGLQYKVNDMVKVYTVLSHVKENKTNTQYYKTRALTLGAGYKLHKQVETFVEGGWNKTKNENAKVVNRDRNVGVGLRVHF